MSINLKIKELPWSVVEQKISSEVLMKQKKAI